MGSQRNVEPERILWDIAGFEDGRGCEPFHLLEAEDDHWLTGSKEASGILVLQSHDTGFGQRPGGAWRSLEEPGGAWR